MKRMLALLICAVMVLSLFAGCGKNTDDPVVTNGTVAGGDNNNNGEITMPNKAGSLMINAGAAMTIIYGEDGLVLKLEGINEDGIALVEIYEDNLGATCVSVVDKFIKDCLARNSLFENNFVVIKQDKGSALPGTNFLESVEKAAQKALEETAPTATLFMVKEENVDADSYIDLVTAEKLVKCFLGVETLTSFDGTPNPVEGMYAFEVAYEQMQDKILVNAQTGGVAQGEVEELEREPEEMEGYTEETSSAEKWYNEATEGTEETAAAEADATEN